MIQFMTKSSNINITTFCILDTTIAWLCSSAADSHRLLRVESSRLGWFFPDHCSMPRA
ncbi:protein of unknown function [Pseudomonas sp. JV241A]|nr:protein of unknown function [Pseudomonas sp. JV241A]